MNSRLPVGFNVGGSDYSEKELIDIGVDGINAESPLDIRRYLNQRD